ncbi:hypothetical protein RCOM_0837900 [Ricinus communis]|uniref:Uncharacterized protein n=1 Tax=Ricinus communis TaxID=3988 RepID=B9S924_RICCO|nr:hypothetical protein RCOM_0837900 [Ricinus communis]
MAAAAAAATTITAPPLDLCAVLSESKRIINAHSRHFLALSVLFLLPISFSITVFPTLQNLLTQSSTLNSKILLSVVVFSPDPSHLFTTRTLILSIAFSVFIFVLALLALGSITYSVLHGFYVIILIVSMLLLVYLQLNWALAVRGELAWEIAEEFAREYVSLPFDDGKLPHLVSVAYA